MSSDIDVLKLEMRPFVKRSVTTAAGNVAGTTLVDEGLTEPNDFWNGMAILIRTGDCAGELRRVLDWDLATNTLTVNVAFSDQIVAGVQYVMFYPTILKTEDLGTHTNPRRYECENSFRSQVATSPDALVHPLWSAATTPARTAGKNTEIYTITVYNHSGATGTIALEIGGAEIYPKIAVAAGDTVVVDLPTPIPVGDNDVDYHASAADIDVMIIGLEV